MKTILAAKDNVAQLWGYPKPGNAEYRLMKYLLRVDVKEGALLHNCVTRQMILLTYDEVKQLEKIPANPGEWIQELIANHFLVPKDYDEYKAVNQLRAIYQRRSTGDAINHYVILPTTFCNAHCFYCYESDYPHVHMTEETARKVVEYINEHSRGNKVSLDWFGGEPLVGINRIDQITKGLKDLGIEYSSYMISNGYLFDESLVRKSIELWKLKRVQITLDGTEEIYNRVKAYTNAAENPYQRVLRNIDLLINNGIHVNIRLNVDFYNKDDILALIEKLGERYSGKDNIAVYLNMLFNNQGFEPVHHSDNDRIELAMIIEQYTNRLKELKLGREEHNLPSLAFSQCMADNPHTIEIQPDGSFCRCEHECINDSYGNLDEGVLDPDKPKKWRENIERSDQCSECCVYPSCFMLKGCMNAELPCIDEFRLRRMDKHKDLMYSLYQKSLEEKKNEKVHGS